MVRSLPGYFIRSILAIVVLVGNITADESGGLVRRKRDAGKGDDPLLTADLFEGDIAGIDSKTLSSAVNGTVHWPDKYMPYVINDQVGFVARRAISKAMVDIERKTCVRFRNATAADQDFVEFVASKGCYSYMGKRGGRQELSIGDGCEQVGTVLHLLMHVLGFWHEESRLDRDLYILINWDNIDQENAKHFEKYSIPRINVDSAINPLSSAYDYDSITHISPYAYAKSKETPTILSKDERYKVGQRLELSQNDVNAVVRAYCGRRQAADVLSKQEKSVYEKTVEQETGQTVEQQRGQTDEDAPLVEPDQPEGCRDTSRKCPLWATRGLCYKNSAVMATKCAGSCQACQMIATCDNFNSLCGIWAWLGNCVGKSAQKYLAACPLACGVCVPEGTADNEANQTTATFIESTASSTTPMVVQETNTTTLTVPTTTSVLPPESPAVTNVAESSSTAAAICEDKNRDCRKWASKGRCFYKHVQRLCPASCNSTCEQLHPGNTPTTKPPTPKGRTTKAHMTRTTKPRPTTTSPACKDQRTNCERFVVKGFCQRPAFRKGCLKSCNMCGVNAMTHDYIAPDDELEMVLSNQYCRDYHRSVCDRLDVSDWRGGCTMNTYVQRLCLAKCKMCDQVEHEHMLRRGSDRNLEEDVV